MHGLMHCALQCFAQDTYGPELWSDTVDEAGLGYDRFEAMLSYPDGVIDEILVILTKRLMCEREQLLEDLGGYLVTHPRMEKVRRLMRFSGANFVDFVLSLDDLQDRTRLAFPDLKLPALNLESHSESAFGVWVQSDMLGFGAVLQGFLRAMADDYGALVMLDRSKVYRNNDSFEHVAVEVFEAEFTVGKTFVLAAEQVAK